MESPGAMVTTTCGLVLDLGEEPTVLESVLCALRSLSGCEAGEAYGRWLPVAVETTNPPAVQKQIEAIPGIQRCEVVFIGSADGLAPLAPSTKHESL